MNNTQLEILAERLSEADAQVTLSDGMAVVELNPDHPGFRDTAYRKRRNQIAQIAVDYRRGQTIPDAPYTDAEHQVWRLVWESLAPVHARFACSDYLDYLHRVALPHDRIPGLQAVSDKIHGFSGFRLEPAAGLVQPQVFLGALSRGIFLSTQYIRHSSTPLYTPEPDVVHDVIGHAAVLAHPELAHLHRLFGQAAERATTADALSRLGHVYWFTIEFGVLRENGALKAYGAGLLSSAGELAAIEHAALRPLDFGEMETQAFDVTQYQPILYCADSFSQICASFEAYLRSWLR